MKKILCIFLLIISCSKNDYPWYNGTLNDALNNNPQNKIIMLDFYTEW